MNEREVTKMFIDLVDEGKCPDPSLDHRHFYGKTWIPKQISPNEYQFSIERHPHLFGRPSVGKPSSAFARIEKTFILNTVTRTIEFGESTLLGIEFDYELLAEEEVESWEYVGMLPTEEIATLQSEEECRKYTKDFLDNLDLEESYITDYDLPENFMEKLKLAIVDEIILKWKRGY